MLLHRLWSQRVSLFLYLFLLSHPFFQLLVEKTPELNEQIYGRNLDFGLLKVLFVSELSYRVGFLRGIVDKLLHEVAHHVNHAERGDLFAGKTHQVEPDLVLVKAALLNVDLLLLCNC
jgi:hypothetical protein